MRKQPKCEKHLTHLTCAENAVVSYFNAWTESPKRGCAFSHAAHCGRCCLTIRNGRRASGIEINFMCMRVELLLPLCAIKRDLKRCTHTTVPIWGHHACISSSLQLVRLPQTLPAAAEHCAALAYLAFPIRTCLRTYYIPLLLQKATRHVKI